MILCGVCASAAPRPFFKGSRVSGMVDPGMWLRQDTLCETSGRYQPSGSSSAQVENRALKREISFFCQKQK